MNKDRNITRIDRQTSGGYLVRITRKGKLHSEFFKDSDCGGKRKALVAARSHRDKMEQKLASYSPKQLSKKVRANNSSGTPGVRYVEDTDPRWPSQPTYGYYVAQWSPKKGVRRTKRFSVAKYGKEKAFQLAVRARNRGVNSMEQ
ncbi:MAG: AP2/ERF family transcription factor [Planctomycetota bacterium]